MYVCGRPTYSQLATKRVISSIARALITALVLIHTPTGAGADAGIGAGAAKEEEEEEEEDMRATFSIELNITHALLRLQQPSFSIRLTISVWPCFLAQVRASLFPYFIVLLKLKSAPLRRSSLAVVVRPSLAANISVVQPYTFCALMSHFPVFNNSSTTGGYFVENIKGVFL